MNRLIILLLIILSNSVFSQSEIGRQFHGKIIRSNHIKGDQALIGIKGNKPGTGLVYFSSNNLKSWKACNNGQAIDQAVADVQAVLLVNDSTFLAGTWKNGLFLSTDTGNTWDPVINFPAKDIRSFAMSDNNPKTIYVATISHGVLVSNNLGKTWIYCSDTSFHKQAAAWSLEIDPSNSNILYALSFKNGIQQSNDKGKTWKNILTHQGMMFYDLVISSKNPTMIYAVGGNDSLGVIYRSKDKGENWEILTELPIGSLNQIELTGLNEKIIVVGSWNKGVFFYVEGNWVHYDAINDMPITDIHSNPAEVIIFSWGNGIFKLPNYWYKNSN